MIKIKIDKNKLNEPVFKLWFKELNEKEERFLIVLIYDEGKWLVESSQRIELELDEQ